MSIMAATLLGFHGIFLVIQFSVSTSSPSPLSIILAEPDSQIIGSYERNDINIAYNISTKTTILSALELCADLGTPLLFTINGTIAGCGTLIMNSTSFPSIATANATDAGKNRSNISSQATTQNFIGLFQAYNTEFYKLISLPVFARADYTVRFSRTNNSGLNCSFDSGEGISPSYIYTNETLNFTHRYLSYGIFRTRAWCLDNSTKLLDTSRRISVNLSSVVENVSCPDLFSTNETLPCVLHVVHATKLGVKVKIGDNLEVNYNISEAPVQVINSKNKALQQLNRTFACNNSDVIKIFTAPSMVLERKVVVQAIALMSNVSGLLRLQVFRPVDYLEKDNQNNLSCPLPSFNQLSNTTVFFQTFFAKTPNISRATSPPQWVTAIHNLTLNVDSGFNFLTLPEEKVFTAHPGDVIHLTINQSVPVNPSPPPDVNHTANSSIPKNNATEISNSSQANFTKSSFKCPEQAFRDLTLFGFLPYEIRICLRFLDPGTLPLEIQVRAGTQDVVSFHQVVLVQKPVDGLQLIYNNIVRYNSTRTLGFQLARGTNASCAWSLSGVGVDVVCAVNCTGKGNGNKSEEVANEILGYNFNYKYDIPGTLTFYVNCSNRVSNISEETSISVRRNVSEFNASLCFADFAYEHARTCWKAVAFGDHVEYRWIIGEQTYTDSRFETTFSGHTTDGYELANVSAFNVVSQENMVLWFKILKNPLTVEVQNCSVCPSLSAVAIAARLVWNGYANGTEFYTAYAVNISESLRQFIIAPTFRIKDAGKVLATNISNATLLSYAFPLAGSKAVEHDVYIEAVGHPEMNRRTKITILDRIQGLKITSDCSSEVVVNKSCSFTASYNQGSDVSCSWTVGRGISQTGCKISYKFEKLGNVTLHVNATNLISSEKTLFSVAVVLSPETYTTSGMGSLISEMASTNSGYGLLSPTVEHSVSMTSGTEESLVTHMASLKPATIVPSSLAPVMSSSTKPSLLQSGDELNITSRLTPFSVTPNSISSMVTPFEKTELFPSPSSGVTSNSITSTTKPPGSIVISGPRFAAAGQKITFIASVTGSNSVLTWSINNDVQANRNSSLPFTFYQPGQYIISLNVSNRSSYQFASFTVIVQSRISDLRVFQKLFNKSVVILFSVSTGTNVSYIVDFGDGFLPNNGSVRELMQNVSVLHEYKKPGQFNVSVTVFNMVVPNLTHHVVVSVKESCKFNSVVLYGAAPEIGLAKNFTESGEVVVSVQTSADCDSPTQLTYRWKILRNDSDISAKVPIKLNIAPLDQPTLRFSAGQINVGLYKVVVTVVALLDSTSVTRRGYFCVVAQSFTVSCSCGIVRTIALNQPLVLNPVVANGFGDVESLKFEWFCDDKLNQSCFRDVIPRNVSLVRFPENFLEENKTYDFVVRVTNGTRKGMTSQSVSVGPVKSTLTLCLRCPQEVKKLVLHTEKAEIMATCIECSGVLNLTWTWRILKTTPCNLKPSCNFEHLILNTNTLVIPANTLKPGAAYRIEVSITGSIFKGFAVYELVTNDLPSGGYCVTTPSQDFALATSFKTACHAWYDTHQPLFFKYWYSVDGGNYSLYFYGNNPESSATYFEAGLAERNYILNIRAVITDSLGASVINTMSVKNVPLNDNKAAEILKSPDGIDRHIETLLNSSDPQSTMQFMRMISGLLNDRSDDDAMKQERTKIRETVLRHLTKLCCPDHHVMKQTLQTMLVVSQVPSELNHKAQTFASSVYLSMSERLSLVSRDESIEADARDLVKGVTYVLSASSLPSNNLTPMDSGQVREINEACLHAIDKLADALLLGMKPEEPPVILTSSLVNVAVQKHLTSNFPGRSVAISTHLTEFVVPEILENLPEPVVSTKLISSSNNPFSWMPTGAVSPTTDVASFELTDSQGQEVTMADLPESFSMFLPVGNTLPVSGNHNAKLDEDSKPDLYEINTTSSNPSLLVTVHDVTTDNEGQLRLQIRKENESAPLFSDVIISTTSSFPFFWTWLNLRGNKKYLVSMKYESLSFRRAGVPNHVQYSISFREVGCYYWNESSDEWQSDGCQVGSFSTIHRTHCQCNHLTWFGSRLVVPPNTLSLSTISSRIRDPSNYTTILAVFCSMFLLYLIILVWARRRDKQDANKNRITWCPSNHVTDSYQYQVIVYTGIRRNAGTTANVGLTLLGESGKSRKCLLKDSRKSVLKRGNVDQFLITTGVHLGEMEYVHIWHDNTGSDPAWFVNRVVVLDSRSGQVWNFLCYRWLAVDEGDGQTQRLLPIADSKELVRFRHLFVSRATSELTDTHLWFSVAFRPVFSPFTRVQRVSCCLSLLLTSMMANAMWYNTGGSGGDQVDLALFTISWEEIFIGVCSSFIVFPINLLLVQIFRHCRAKPSAKSSSILENFFEKKKMSSMSSFFNIPSSAKARPLQSRDLASSTTLSPDTTLSDVTPSNVLSPKMTPIRTTSQLSYSMGPLEAISPKPGSRTVTLSRGMASSPQFKAAIQCNEAHLLPHWLRYLGWLGVLVTCLTSATVTFMYGVDFGESKTKKWLLSLTISLVNDVFIAQPLKVVAVAVVLAYIVKKPLKERYASDDAVRHEAFESVVRESPVLEAPDPSLCSAEDFLQKAREKREKDKFMHGLLKTATSYLVFTGLVLIIAYGQRDPRAYYLTRVQENTFTRPGFLPKLHRRPERGYHQVANVRDFWLWNQRVFLPGLSNIMWYNYTRKWSKFTGNFGGFLIGAARWRQKRLKQGICEVLPEFLDTIPNCTGNYDWDDEDSNNYFWTWRTPVVNKSCSKTDTSAEFWCYSTSSASKSFPYVGVLETYSGGGFSKDILQNLDGGLNLTGELEEHRWIDKYTRAVFVEFTLYNPNVNLFSVVTLLYEISSSGNFNPMADILTFRLYNYVGNFQIVIVICQLFFLGFVCYFTYHSAKLLFKKKWRFFQETWNVHELAVVGTSWLVVAFYFVSMVFREWILREFRDDPTRFISFWYSTTWQMTLEYGIAWLVFLVSLKFLRLFQFNRRMFLLPLTLSNTALDLLNYSLVFFIVLTAFTLLYHLLLHPYNPDFVSVIVTVETLIRVLLGKSDSVVKNHYYPVLERVILFCYICLMKFILLNVFVVILNDGFLLARAHNDRQRNEFEFLEFMKHTVYEFLGIRRLNKNSERGSVKRRRVRFLDNEATSLDQVLDELEQKVERLWQAVHSQSFEENMLEPEY